MAWRGNSVWWVIGVIGIVALFVVAVGPVPSRAADGSGLAVIGDSITWQATDEIETLAPGVRVHAEIGWNFNRAIPELQAILAGGTPEVLVVALGTNPPLTLDRIDAFMQVAADIEHVIFVTIRIPASWEVSTNQLINSLPSQYDQISILDWNAHSNARPWVFNSSGYHLSETGKPEFASFVVGGAYAVAGACDPPTQTIEGSAGVGVVDPATGLWWFRDPLTGATTSIYYGNPGDSPFVGDWDGDGIDTPGLYRRSDGYVYLRNANTQGVADVAFFFGDPGDVPLPGDFDGDGRDTVAVYRPSNQRFYLINQLGSDDTGLGAADRELAFGNPGDIPVAGDFDGDGIDDIGVYRNGLVVTSSGSSFLFGDAGDLPIVGSWDGGASDAVGIYRDRTATFALRATNTQGAADHSFSYGAPGFRPIAGVFGELPGLDDAPRLIPCPVAP